MEKSEILQDYYGNEGAKLHTLVDRLLKPWRGAYSDFERDEFDSIANGVFAEIIDKYAPGTGNFEAFLSSCLTRRFKDYFSMKNRKKRMIQYQDEDGNTERVHTVSLNTYISEDDEDELMDVIPGGKSVEEIVFKDMDDSADDFLRSLSERQKNIVTMLLSDCTREEITKKLGITQTTYEQEMKCLRSFEKRMLFHGAVTKKKEGESKSMTLENNKSIQYSVDAIERKIKNHSMRLDHPLQRYSDQWDTETRDNYISDILHGNPIPEIIIAEQIVNDHAIVWALDGCQRITTSLNYKWGGFSIGKTKVERPIIKYQTIEEDEDGDLVYLDKEFDIRGKKFSQLPKELQERLGNYVIRGTMFLNCSNQDIEYHIRRYNRSRPMNQAQKAITFIGEEYGKIVKSLSRHNFFKNNPTITKRKETRGEIDRCIMDTLMSLFFMDCWNKDTRLNANFMKENLTVTQTNNLRSLLDRLEEICTEDIKSLFTTSNTYIFINLFNKFTKSGYEDSRFAEFLTAFKDGLHSKVIDGKSFDDFSGGASKDKKFVMEKMAFLENLMADFLGTEKTKEKTFEISNLEVKKYIDKFKKHPYIKRLGHIPENKLVKVALQCLFVKTTDMSDEELETEANIGAITDEEINDCFFYIDILDDLSVEVDNNSKIFDIEMLPAILGAIAYGINTDDTDVLEKWFVKYVEKFDSHIGNKSSSLILNTSEMIRDLETYITYQECA